VIENVAKNNSTKDVSEEHVASIFRVEEYVKHKTSVRQMGSRTLHGLHILYSSPNVMRVITSRTRWEEWRR
jgi:hypothetical protein